MDETCDVARSEAEIRARSNCGQNRRQAMQKFANFQGILEPVAIDTNRVSEFRKGPPQIHFTDSLALRDSQEMSTSTANPDRIAKGWRTMDQFTAGDAGNASSGKHERS
jgi:hypothetical protein